MDKLPESMDSSVDSITVRQSSALSPLERLEHLLALFEALVYSKERSQAAREIAFFFDASDSIVFVRDEQLGVLIPALGFPQTIRGIDSYRTLLEKALERGISYGELLGPAGPTRAVAVASRAVILFFGVEAISQWQDILPHLRLVQAVFGPERKRVALEGELEVASKTAYEVQALAAQLDVARKELERRVLERTEELREALEEAEAFNYAISHNLRAPLRAIVSTSRIAVQESSDLPETLRSLLERQAYNANQLAKLIDDLLRLSRLSRMELQPRFVDVSSLAHSIAHDLDTECPVHIQPDMVAECDPQLLLLVLRNLIDNACKFSPSHTPIWIGSEEGAFYVRDRGVGFDMKYAAKVFLPFERLVLDTEFPGTGIGLATVDRIIKRHNGSVWAESKIGEGATFYFRFGNSS